MAGSFLGTQIALSVSFATQVVMIIVIVTITSFHIPERVLGVCGPSDEVRLTMH